MLHAIPFRKRYLNQALSVSLLSLSLPYLAFGQESVNLGSVGSQSGAGQIVEVAAKRDSVAAVAPTQVNLTTTEPQSIISRAYIEQSVAPTGNFNTIAGISPGASTQPSSNGPGAADTKTVLRGFQDSQYNVTWDGIPFGDTNDPTHHSTAYFPAAVIGGVVVERGPGNASNLGQATYGGSINLYSKTPAAKAATEVYFSHGNWNTNLYGIGFESGKFGENGSTLQLNVQQIKSDGYLSYNTMDGANFVAKYQQKLGSNTRLTVFATYNDIKAALPDSTSGATLAQAALFGKNYSLNNDPTSQGYYGYNTVHKKTDFEYLRLQSDWGNGFQTDNNLYSYFYDNQTIAGFDASGYLGHGVIAAGAGTNASSYSGAKVPAGGVLGYDKLNHYRVTGDILKATKEFSNGLLRAGLWLEQSDTIRHQYGLDVSTMTLLDPTLAGKGTKFNQDSSWKQYQPFVEFEWAVTDSTTVTPGFKYSHFTRSVDAIKNQGSNIAANFSETFTSSLPFLTVNHMLDKDDALYLQYAKGMQVPILGTALQVTNPGNTPDPQTTTNYQFGGVHKSDRFHFAADVYYIDFNNQIGSSVVAGQTVFFNQGGTVYKGFETEGTWLVDGGWALYANYSYNSAKFKSNNTAGVGTIAKAPKMTAALGLLFNQGPWNASLIYKQVGDQYAVNNEPAAYKIDGYGNTDLNAAYTFGDLGSMIKKLKVQFSIYNITNSQKVTAISTGATMALDQYQWQAPRSYMVSLKGYF
ncbi:iron complex outermembrane receptor protein [Undibacterium sp. GrIS 1.2]|uniref:TonB-dependent receptor n=1 Tax=Undibacterium sp. GrIS 1.2 TaxID=3143933 RepID=UPI00339B5FF1